jgi:hypothetical protein
MELKYFHCISVDLIIYVRAVPTSLTKHWFLSDGSILSKQKQVNPNLAKGTNSEDRTI